jgi:hydrogenase nickel incorporation protein HypA/HybF
MHEMALCESVLQIVESTARRHGAARVRSVRLEIGRLSHVEPDALRFAFDVVTRRSLADGASLDIVDVPGTAWCMQCATTVAIDRRGDGCPACGSYQLQVTGGEDMRVKDIEIY